MAELTNAEIEAAEALKATENAEAERLVAEAAAKEKTFTQSELDDVVKARLSRATKDMPSKDELTAYKAWQDSQKSEQQKAIDTQLAVEATLKKANDRLILAEIMNLKDYDVKLVSRLIDQSKIKIDDEGNVTGLKEAVDLLAIEFPQIKKTNPTGSPANPPPAGAKTTEDDYNEALTAAQKDPSNSTLRQIVFQLKEKLKK